MNINRSNYEVYFLDYLDGNLPEDRIDDFLDFLSNNPDLREELEQVSAIKITGGNHPFQNKQALLKNELTGTSAFDSRAVAFLENDLPEEDQTAFLNELTSDREKEKQFDWFLKTKLQPDPAIVFPNKASLLKKPAKKVFLFWGTRVAAVLVLLLVVWAVWDFSPKPEPTHQLAQEQPIVNPDQKPLPAKNELGDAAPERDTDQQPSAPQVQPLAFEAVQAVQPTIQKISAPDTDELMVSREAVPQKLKPLSSPLEIAPAAEQFALAEMKTHRPDSPTDYLTVDEYLAQKVLNKPKDEPLTIGSLLSAGLNAVASVSNDRLEYETNTRGKVSEISLNTRILAFSIPLKKDQ